VFAAWSDPAKKAAWFGPPEKPPGAHTLEFRVGGREHLEIVMPDGPRYSFDARYQDIVHEQRIVYTYDMHRNEDRISISVATVELEPHDGGTQLTLVEQGVFLDGLDTSDAREDGTRGLMDALGAYLQGAGDGA
jgi:uncharacterized protein YndB with AHSA1/START domain